MQYPQPYASGAVPTASAPPYPTVMAVIGPQYCCPYPVDLAIVRKVLTVADQFTVTDINGNVVFKLQASLLTLHDRRVLLDAAQNPVVTLRRKVMTVHDRWQAFRGDSTDPKDLIFTLKRSSLIQLVRTKLDVFLASNTTEQVCDFKIKGSWLERSCVVYAGESNTIVAQMHKKHTVQSVMFGKTNFMVTVYPNVDYAFIAALIVILDEINQDSKSDSSIADELLM
ncbi:protein LURP-one-related 10-like [Prosopis cineraria]|uniref:protein LURP-one-related 10-like n=1 Tax=Prosopis cineraria TaxID=364024 RepID=UPI00240FEF98|nr:protein LURP-one-related 10-like [Prosopis cineraria]